MKKRLLAGLSIVVFCIVSSTVYAAGEKATTASPERSGGDWSTAGHEIEEAAHAVGDATVESSKQVWESTKKSSSEAWHATKEGSAEAWKATKKKSKRVWEDGKSAIHEATAPDAPTPEAD